MALTVLGSQTPLHAMSVRIIAKEIACQTKRSEVNPRTPRPVKSGTRDTGSDSDAGTAGPGPSAPGEAFIISCARDRYPVGRDRHPGFGICGAR